MRSTRLPSVCEHDKKISNRSAFNEHGVVKDLVPLDSGTGHSKTLGSCGARGARGEGTCIGRVSSWCASGIGILASALRCAKHIHQLISDLAESLAFAACSPNPSDSSPKSPLSLEPIEDCLDSHSIFIGCLSLASIDLRRVGSSRHVHLCTERGYDQHKLYDRAELRTKTSSCHVEMSTALLKTIHSTFSTHGGEVDEPL